jgi:uncharacterized protein (TIRG00374 family)
MEIKKNYKKWLAISIVVSVVSIVIIYMLGSTREAGEIILTLNPYIILLAAGLNVISWFAWALRVKVLSAALNIKVPYKKAFKIVMVSHFVAAVTPSAAGGEPMRIYMLTQDDIAKGDTSVGNATAVTLGERLIDFIFFGSALPILLFLVGLSVNLTALRYFLIAASALVGLAGVLLFYIVTHPQKFKKYSKKLGKLLKYVIKDDEKKERTVSKMENEFGVFSSSLINLFVHKKWHLLATLGITAIMWISGFLIPSVILLGLGLHPIWLLSLTFQIIIIFITMIPISPGGSGLAEFSAYFLYGQQVPQSVIGPLILVWRILTFYMNLTTGLAYTIHYIAKSK